MKHIFALLLMGISSISIAQLSTDSGFISFYSETGDITAENEKVSCKLDVNTGEITFLVDINEFQFKNKTMQKHFNQEGVMHSDKFPKASYKGTITNNSSNDYTADGSYSVNVKGKMTIKGVSKDFVASGTINVKEGQITALSEFKLNRFEYGVDGKKNSVSKVLAISVKIKF